MNSFRFFCIPFTTEVNRDFQFLAKSVYIDFIWHIKYTKRIVHSRKQTEYAGKFANAKTPPYEGNKRRCKINVL